MPEQPPAPAATNRAADDDGYKLNSLPAEPTGEAIARLCPNCHERVAPEAVICVGCGWNLRENRATTATHKPEPTETSKPGIVSRVMPWQVIALVANGCVLLAGAANLLMGNCCMGVVALPIGIYNIKVLLDRTFDASMRTAMVVVNILAIGCGIAGFPLALYVRDSVVQVIDLPEAFHQYIVINVFAVAAALLVAGTVTLVATGLRKVD